MRLAAPLALLICLASVAAPPSGDAPEAGLPPPPARDFTRESSYEVLDVRAGNAIVVQLSGEQRVLRLIGVFVPQAGSDDDAARSYLWQLLRGERVYISYESDHPLRDRDGRYWCYLHRAPDGLFLNLELLRLGLAEVSAADPFEHQRLFEAYEKHARLKQKGLWNGETPPPASQATSRPAEAVEKRDDPKKPGDPAPTQTDGPTVYVTPGGARYHTGACQYAKGGRATAITLAEAKARGLTPCSRCKPPD